jgi:hypothetical protein
VFQLDRIVLKPNSYDKEDSSLLASPTREAFMVFANDPPVDEETQSAENRCVQNNAKRAQCHQAEAADANANANDNDPKDLKVHLQLVKCLDNRHNTTTIIGASLSALTTSLVASI